MANRFVSLAVLLGVGFTLSAPQVCAGLFTRQVTLVRDGQPAAVIVLAATAPPAAQLAAFELQWHIRKITGATLDIVPDEPLPGGTKILVGESAATQALGLRAAEFATQEYRVRVAPPDTVVLLGRDTPGTQKVDYAKRETFPDRFSEIGTLHAVYDFLERRCGVRWYLPTELGIACSQTPTLRVAAVDLRRPPFMRYRDLPTAYAITNDLCGETVKSAWPKERKGLDWREQMLWAFRQRLGGEPYAANHSLMWPEEYAAHPDWFAKGYDEEMKKNPGAFLKNKAGQPVPPQLCYSQPAVLEFVVRQARDFFDGKGTSIRGLGDCVALVPADGGRFCRCDACRAKQRTGPAVADVGRWLSGKGSEYVWDFVNRVARELRKTHPAKTVGALAYEDYAMVPPGEIEPNIIPMFTLGIRLAHDPIQEAHEWGLFDAWVKRMNGRPLYVWLYYNFPVDNAVWGNYRCFPGFAAHATARYVKKLAACGVRGIFIEPGVHNEWSRDVLFGQLDEYVTWKLADDPALAADRLIDEFFDRFYGAAAKPMRDLYTRIEETYCTPATYTQGEILVFDILDKAGGGTPPLAPGTLRAAGFRVTQLTDTKWQDRVTQLANLRVTRLAGSREDGVLLEETFGTSNVQRPTSNVQRSESLPEGQKTASSGRSGDSLKAGHPPSSTLARPRDNGWCTGFSLKRLLGWNLREASADAWPGDWVAGPDFRLTKDGDRTCLELPWNAKGGTAICGLRNLPRPGDGLRLTWEHRADGYDFYRSWQFFLATAPTPEAVTGYAVTYERNGWTAKTYMDVLKLADAAPAKNVGTVFKLYGDAKPAGGWSPCPAKDAPASSLPRSQAVATGAWTRFRLDVTPEAGGTRLRLFMRNAASAVRRPVGHQTEELAWGLLGTRERMAEFGKLMDAAKAAAKTDLEKQRVDLFDRGVWQYMLNGKAAYGGDAERNR